MKKSQTDGPLESPISFHAGSNGEFAPHPITAADRRAAELYRRIRRELALRNAMVR